MKGKCHQYVEYYDTANKPVYSWKCYCGTTACLEMVGIHNFASVQIFKTKRADELTPEEEKLFYKKAFKTKLL